MADRFDEVSGSERGTCSRGRVIRHGGAVLLATFLILGCGTEDSALEAGQSSPSAPTAAATLAPTAAPTPTHMATPRPTVESTPVPTPESETEAPSQQPPSDLAQSIDGVVEELARSGEFSGSVLVAREGEVLLSKGYGFADQAQKLPNGPETRFRIASLTKQFTAMAILILQTQGLVHVDDSICDHIADCPAAWQEITIHQLLTHTAGVPDFTRFADYAATKAMPSSLQDTIDRFRDRPLDFVPGSTWDYTNSGYILLGEIIEQASGKSFASFVQDQIFGPLGMTRSGYDDGLDRAVGYRRGATPADVIDMSIPHAAGGLVSTVEDLYRWDQALYTEQLLPATLLAEMFLPYATIPDSDGAAYGYGWVIEQDGDRTLIGHNGGIEGFVGSISRFPDARATVIFLSNQQSVNPRRMADLLSMPLLDGQ